MNLKDQKLRKLYSVREASDYLQLCESAVRRLVHKGILCRRTDISTRGWRFSQKQLDDFLNEGIKGNHNEKE